MSNCPFCSSSADDVWLLSEHAMAVPAADPLAPGHALVAPRRHVSGFYDLDVQEQRMVWDMVAQIRTAVSQSLKVDEFHIGFADFRGAAGHAHIHVVPRNAQDAFTLPPEIEWIAE